MTSYNSAWAYLFQVAASGLLVRAAWTDLREYRIPNGLILALTGLFIFYAVVTAHWAGLKWDLAFAGLMFLVLLALYVLGGMGGGDVKILPVAFLWTGLSGAFPFAVLLAIFGVMHGIAAKCGWVKSQVTESGRRRIPFAPAVAGALICTFMLRAFQLA